MNKNSKAKEQLLSVFKDDISCMEDDILEQQRLKYIERERDANSYNRKCTAVLENGYVCTSAVEYDLTADLNTLSLFELIQKKAYLKSLAVDYSTAYGHQIKEALETLELQIQKILVLISAVKNEIIKIFIPTVNEFQISAILVGLLKQQFLYTHQLKTNSF